MTAESLLRWIESKCEAKVLEPDSKVNLGIAILTKISWFWKERE